VFFELCKCVSFEPQNFEDVSFQTNMMKLLCLLLQSLDDEQVRYFQDVAGKHAQEQEESLGRIRAYLFSNLRSKAAPNIRDTSLRLSAALMRTLNVDWLYHAPPKNDTLQKGKQPVREPTSFFTSFSDTESIREQLSTLLIHLSCVEIRVILDVMGNRLQKEQSLVAETREREAVLSSTQILERTLIFIVNESEHVKKNTTGLGVLRWETILRLRQVIAETMNDVLAFFKDFQSFSIPLVSVLEEPIMIMLLRVMGVWISEDDMLHPTIATLAPWFRDLFVHAAATMIPSKVSSDAEQEKNMNAAGSDALALLAPGLLYMCQENPLLRHQLYESGLLPAVQTYVAALEGKSGDKDGVLIHLEALVLELEVEKAEEQEYGQGVRE